MFTLRRAEESDLDALVRLRIDFLRELKPLEDPILGEVTEANRLYFREYLSRSELAAWVAEVEGDIIGTGMVVFITRPPRPHSLSGKDAYLLGMYTVPAWRRRGVATALLQEIIDSVKRTDASSIILYALEDGRSIYEKAGFQYRPDNMQLVW